MRSPQDLCLTAQPWFRSAPLDLLFVHKNFCQLLVLFEDRDRLVDQSLEFIVAGILSLLLKLADQSLVIGACLPQEKSVKIRTARGIQLRSSCFSCAAWCRFSRCAAALFVRCAPLCWAIATTA